VSEHTVDYDAAADLTERLAFALFGGSRDVWDRVPAEREHYLRSARLLLPIAADLWDEGYDVRGEDIANEGLTERTLTPNPYRVTPPGEGRA
jgi:hypothetical protein